MRNVSRRAESHGHVDYLAAVLKGEERTTLLNVVGVLGVTYVTRVVPGIAVFGTDAWSLTKEVGEKVGGVAKDVVGTIGSVIEDAVEPIGDAVEFITDLF